MDNNSRVKDLKSMHKFSMTPTNRKNDSRFSNKNTSVSQNFNNELNYNANDILKE